MSQITAKNTINTIQGMAIAIVSTRTTEVGLLLRQSPPLLTLIAVILSYAPKMSYGIDTNNTWPYVTVPNYPERGNQMLAVTGVQYSSYGPLVTEEGRAAWETWSVQNQDWIPKELDTRKPGDNSSLIPTHIWQNPTNPEPADAVQPGTYHAPIWQMAPVLPFFINYDLLTVPGLYPVFEESVRTHDVAHGDIQGISDTWDPSAPFTWPSIHVVGPIFDSFQGNSTVVAILASVVHWHLIFQNLIPQGTPGIIVVVKNTCDQVVTYEVKGPNVTYLGPGDHHDPQFDEFETSGRFHILKNENRCLFTLNVFPSREYYESSLTNNPVIYSIAVVAIFFLTMAVFMLYDCFVQKRQEKVMHSAKRSNAIVRYESIAVHVLGREHFSLPSDQKWSTAVSHFPL